MDGKCKRHERGGKALEKKKGNTLNGSVHPNQENIVMRGEGGGRTVISQGNISGSGKLE